MKINHFITLCLQSTHKELFMRKEINQVNQVSIDARKYKELEQRLHDEQARHQKLTNGLYNILFYFS